VTSTTPAFLGLDFGTESIRASIVDASGRQLGVGVAAYAHGQIVPGSAGQQRLFPKGLAPDVALQHPGDWIESMTDGVRKAMASSGLAPNAIGGIGVSFTSCTMLPALMDASPLCESLPNDPHAWPKLWKHHGATAQTARLNDLASRRAEPWLDRYGGIVGLEWLFPKILEVVEMSAPAAYRAEVWLEAGDWLVWRLTGRLVRSTSQAGYKALWSQDDGFPSIEFLGELHPSLVDVVERKLPGEFVAPGVTAGELTEDMAKRLGLSPGIPVSAAIIDAHAGVPGSGVGEPGTLVMVMGTSGCHMLLAEQERHVPGVAGIVRDGILPGFVGYETGQAAMGDAFDWVRRLAGEADFKSLDALATDIPAGAEGVLCIDWLNGCRTPLMDGSLQGGFVGLGMHHGAGQVYRATLEGAAMGLRWIVDTLREGGVPVERFVGTGGLPSSNPLFTRIVASVLQAPVQVHASAHGSALGAAILGAMVAGREGGGFDDAHEAIEHMSGKASSLGPPSVIELDPDWANTYQGVYKRYRALADEWRRPDSPARSPRFDA